MRPRIVHVVESLGAGVESAVMQWRRSTPEFDHVLLASPRHGTLTGEESTSDPEYARLPDGFAGRLVSTSATIRQLRPDIVHAHSSLAGLFARVRAVEVPVVYSPHCFAMERLDVRPLARKTFRRVELVLARRTAVFAAVSPRELELAHALMPGVRGVVVPNFAEVGQRRAIERDVPHGDRLRVAVVGRITAQKDPEFVAALARDLGSDASVTWFGGGSATDEALLRGSGVNVTGWMHREDVLDALVTQDVYVHCAAWEGAPISLLEAHAIGLPIAARDIPALRSMGLRHLGERPADVARTVRSLRPAVSRRERVSADAVDLRAYGSELQRERLLETYAAALERV